MKRNLVDAKYKWDFTHVYNSIEDWNKDLEKIKQQIEKLKSFKGKINNKETFKEFVMLDEDISRRADKLDYYCHYVDVDTRQIEFQKLRNSLTNVYSNYSEATAFFEPELKRIGENKVLDWIESDLDLKRYKLSYKNLFRSMKYVLSEKDEELISKLSKSLSQIYEMYDLLSYADKKPEMFTFEGKEQELTSSLLAKIMQESDPIKDQRLRIDASLKFYNHYISHKNSYAGIYAGVINSAVDNMKIRGFDSILQMELFADNFDPKVYNYLIKYATEKSHILKKYYLMIKEHFGFEKFYFTDAALMLTRDKEFMNKEYSVEDAKELIRTAFQPLGQEYLEKLEIAWGPNRVDYYEDTNKRSGAYSLSVHDLEPVILMNWTNKFDSVNTLAHEIGHSVHSLFATENNDYTNSGTPILIAEVASTINEQILFDYMLKNAKSDSEKIYLLQERISDIKGTFFNQIDYAEFELLAHNAAVNGESLDHETLAKLWEETSWRFRDKEVFDEIEEEDVKYSWPYVSHFYHSPFYVYKYATCIVAAFKLYENVKNNKPEVLIDFLKQGCRKNPLDLLKDFGVDYEKNDCYDSLVSILENLINQLAELLRKQKGV